MWPQSFWVSDGLGLFATIHSCHGLSCAQLPFSASPPNSLPGCTLPSLGISPGPVSSYSSCHLPNPGDPRPKHLRKPHGAQHSTHTTPIPVLGASSPPPSEPLYASAPSTKPTVPLDSTLPSSSPATPSSGLLPQRACTSGWSPPHSPQLKGLQGNRTLILVNTCCSSKASYTGFLPSLSPLIGPAFSLPGRKTCPSHSS